MMQFTVCIERDLTTGWLVGSIPGLAAAHSQGGTIDEVRANLAEVIELLRAENALQMESAYVATTLLEVSWALADGAVFAGTSDEL